VPEHVCLLLFLRDFWPHRDTPAARSQVSTAGKGNKQVTRAAIEFYGDSPQQRPAKPPHPLGTGVREACAFARTGRGHVGICWRRHGGAGLLLFGCSAKSTRRQAKPLPQTEPTLWFGCKRASQLLPRAPERLGLSDHRHKQNVIF